MQSDVVVSWSSLERGTVFPFVLLGSSGVVVEPVPFRSGNPRGRQECS